MKKVLLLILLVLTMMIPVSALADTGSTSLETTVAAQVVSFSIDPTALRFGTVVVGTDSDVVNFTVHNTGNVPLKVAAAVTGSGLYTNCLKLQQGAWDWATVVGWTSPTIPAGGSLIISAKIVHPTAEFVGTKAGTLTFTSTADLP